MSVDVEQQTDEAGKIPQDLRQALELLAARDETIAILLDRIRQLEKSLYGPRSAKRSGPIDPSTLLPFPGIEELLEQIAKRAEEREAEAPAPPPKPPKKPNKRRDLDPDSLGADVPRRRRERKLAEDECKCCCGGELHEVREEISSRVERIKVVYIDDRVTTYYACRKCERMVSAAPDETNVIEGSILGPNLLADLVYQRFANHTPYNRLAIEFANDGLPLSRSILSRAVLACGTLLEPIYDQVREEVLSSFLVQIDDTPVVVRNGQAKGRTTGRVWVYRSAEGNVAFEFRMDRKKEGPLGMLGQYRGFVQGDDYSGHACLFDPSYERVSLLCWAHAVRKFRDAETSSPRLSKEFDVLFALLHAVELEAKGMSPPERFRYRAKHARPVLAEIKDWVDGRRLTVTPKSKIGVALEYLHSNWTALNNYLLDGRILDITNNGAERALRRVAVGRKNWMFIGHEEAGGPAAVLMSLLQTCVEQGVNAVAYLRDVLERISHPGSAKDVRELTPSAWKRSKDAQARAAQRQAAINAAVQSLALAPRR